MGKTIVFWSREIEYGDRIQVISALACFLGITEEKKVAVTALPGQRSGFLDAFNIRIPEKIRRGKDSNAGFYPLLQRAIFEKPTEKMVVEAGIHTINKGPLLFPWFDAETNSGTEKNAVTLMMGILKESFDFLLIDAGYGAKEEYGELLLKNADVTIVLLPQDKRRWKDYFEQQPLSGTGKFIYVICPYLKNSAYTEGYFAGHFGKERLCVAGIAADALFMDACTEGRAAEFFLETLKSKKHQKTDFFKDVHSLGKGVMGRDLV